MHRNPRRASPRLVRVCVLTIVLMLSVGTLAPTARATTSAEQAVHALINEARANAGVRRLRLSERLSRIAHRHSRAMAINRYLFHSCLTCIGGTILGENVGYGADFRSVQTQFMESPPHRANILAKRFRRVGVGVVRRGGLAWVTQIFFG